MRTENMTVSDAAHSVGVPLAVLAELGRLSQEDQPMLPVRRVSSEEILS